MAKKSKMPTDVNQRAKAIVDFATGTEDPPDPDEAKDPAAVALGRKGGAKGGRARAEKLSAEERSAIAKRGAAARWGTKKPG
jgi:hypothetical protein